MKTATLEEVCDLLTDGTHYTPPAIPEGFPFLTVKDVTEAGLDFEGCSKISGQEYERARQQNSAPQVGDVLFSKDGTVGKVHLVLERTNFAVLSSLAILRPNTRVVAAGYLAHFLKNSTTLDAALRARTGSAVRRIVLRDISRLTISLPPLSEQCRIAAILDQAATLRRKRMEYLHQLKRLGETLVIGAVKRALARGRVSRLGELVHEFRYGTSEKSGEGGYPVLRIPNVVSDKVNLDDLKHVALAPTEAKRLLLRPGDLLFVRTNGNKEYIARSAVVTESLGAAIGLRPSDFVFASYLIRGRLRSGAINPVYLQAFLGSYEGRRAILSRARTSAGQFNINIEGLASLPIVVPSAAEQSDLARALEDIDRQAAVHRSNLERLDALFASLQHLAFRGGLTSGAQARLELA